MFFKKKKRYSDYVIDLGKLKSRGIVTDTEDSAQNTETSSAAQTEGFGFLSNLASAAETSSNSDTISPSSSSDATSSYDERDLPLSLRDKIRSLSEKMYKLLDRIDLLEHKIDRIERRLNLREGL